MNDPGTVTAIGDLNSTGRLVCFINGSFGHVPMLSVLTSNLASQPEAEAGTDNAKTMTPLRTAQAIAANRFVDGLDGVTANTTMSVPAGWGIDNLFIVNTTANAITGGIMIGTTNGASDVALMAVGANAIVDSFQSLDWVLLKRLFSTSAAQTLFIQAVTSWNSASIRIRIQRTKLF